MFTPRYYQTEAHEAAIEHARKSLESQVIVLPTGSGKSPLISMIAKSLHEITGKKILCTAPTAELVTQNQAKYKSYGYKSSVYCASAGRKELRHDVVFGSPLTLLNSIKRLKGFSTVIIDECDLISTTVRSLIEGLKQDNPNLRVIGLTATPYRMGMGYIYASHYKHGFVQETHEPYFSKCTYEEYAKNLIEHDPPYLTKPVLGRQELHYNTDGLILKSNDKFDAATVDQAFVGKGRLTSDIVADIVDATREFNGVMIFASTIQHAEEIMESLPAELSGIVHSKNPDRKKVMAAFSKQRIKYIVNVDILTVGIDWPHVNCIAMLRRTESARLYQQIIGRGTRLYPGKEFFLILDYAENISAHFPDRDVFNPTIKAKSNNEVEKLTAICPECQHENQFAARPNDVGYALHENGYFVWSDTGDIAQDMEGRKVPSHFGRRCFGLVGRTERCNYRWTFKKCEKCEHENDIAARFCEKCKAEIIDPNEKLVLEQQAAKKEQDEKHFKEPVMSINIEENFKGDNRIKVVTIKTIFNKNIREFCNVINEKQRDKYRFYRDASTDNLQIEFYKPQGKPFYKVVGTRYESL